MFIRLMHNLSRSTDLIKSQINNLFHKTKLESADLDQIEDALLMTDFGIEATSWIRKEISNKNLEIESSQPTIMRVLADTVTEMLQPAEHSLHSIQSFPQVILVVGVNGSGKTTTVAKMAYQYVKQHKRVLLVAGDTFRAAAAEQLSIWAKRVGCEIITTQLNGDAAGLIYDALYVARNESYDLVLIDTAGRLHTKCNLMQELEKINRVIKKFSDSYFYHKLLVLDGTTGQNAINQVKAFDDCVALTGLIVTKLDGTSKAGIIISLFRRFNLPICAIGIGEKIEDLQGFDARNFAYAMFAIKNE